jgi:hypothetical protein
MIVTRASVQKGSYGSAFIWRKPGKFPTSNVCESAADLCKYALGSSLIEDHLQDQCGRDKYKQKGVPRVSPCVPVSICFPVKCSSA